MPLPRPMRYERNHRLTGRVRFQMITEKRWFGSWHRLALCVEEEFELVSLVAPLPPGKEAAAPSVKQAIWRTPTPLEVASPALRWLIDGPPQSEKI